MGIVKRRKKMKKFFIERVFSLSLSLLCNHVNIVRSADTYANTSLASQNITDILKSKVTVNGTEEIDANDLYYNSTDIPEDDYVEFSSLHPNKARDLYRVAMKKNLMIEQEYNKTVGRQARQSVRISEDEAYWSNPFFVSKAMDLMTQSVYATRYRLRETRELRKRLSKHIEYNSAMMYGSLMQLRIKMDNLYTTMKRFKPRRTKFIWYLVLYERCVSFHVDISQMVQEMFELDRRHQKMIAMDDHDEGEMPQGPPHGPPVPN